MNRKKHVYYGIIIAVAATAITWYIAEYITEISGANRELIETVAGISPVAVLFWVSFWVLVGSVYILIIQPRKNAIQTGRKSMADLEKNKK